MTGAADGDTFGNGLPNAENITDRFRKNVAQDTGDDDGSHRNGNVTSQFFCHADADRCGDGFWQHGHIGGTAQPKEAGKGQHRNHGNNNAGRDPEHDSLKISFQCIQLSVQGYRQADSGRRHQITDVFRAVVVRFVVDSKQVQKQDRKDDGY